MKTKLIENQEKCYSIILKKNNKIVLETRWDNNIYFRQNRSYDVYMSFPDFKNFIRINRKKLVPKGYILTVNTIKKEKRWQ